MAITATFLADTEQFRREIDKAEKALDQFEKETIEAGGAITGLNRVSDIAAPKATALGAGVKAAGLLAGAAGISIGGLTGSVTGIATAAAAAVVGLGTIGTAIAGLTSFLSGAALGRKIAEYFGTDQIIGDATAAILGWGNTFKETALNVEASLKKASDIVGYEVTNMTDAVRILTDEQKRNNEEAKKAAEAQKTFKAAVEDVVVAGQSHWWILRQMNQEQLYAAKYALEHGAAQTSVVAAYELTKPQIAAITDLIKKEGEARKDAAEKTKQAAADIAKADAEALAQMEKDAAAITAITDRVFGVDALKKAQVWNEAIIRMGDSVNHLRSAELEELNATMLEGIDALGRSGQLTNEQSSRFAELAIRAQEALAAMRPLVTTTDDLVTAQWDYVTALDEANKNAAEVPPAMGPAKDSIDAIGGAAGQAADNFFSMSEGLYSAIRAAQNQDAMNSLVPAWGITHPAPGQGIIRNIQPGSVQVNINSPLGTPDQIAKAVGGALTGSYSSGGQRLPV